MRRPCLFVLHGLTAQGVRWGIPSSSTLSQLEQHIAALDSLACSLNCSADIGDLQQQFATTSHCLRAQHDIVRIDEDISDTTLLKCSHVYTSRWSPPLARLLALVIVGMFSMGFLYMVAWATGAILRIPECIHEINRKLDVIMADGGWDM